MIKQAFKRTKALFIIIKLLIVVKSNKPSSLNNKKQNQHLFWKITERKLATSFEHTSLKKIMRCQRNQIVLLCRMQRALERLASFPWATGHPLPLAPVSCNSCWQKKNHVMSLLDDRVTSLLEETWKWFLSCLGLMTSWCDITYGFSPKVISCHHKATLPYPSQLLSVASWLAAPPQVQKWERMCWLCNAKFQSRSVFLLSALYLPLT